ncbi:MAG: hypothetical protein ACLFTK_00260 [Anaerolineales bacterium]
MSQSTSVLNTTTLQQALNAIRRGRPLPNKHALLAMAIVQADMARLSHLDVQSQQLFVIEDRLRSMLEDALGITHQHDPKCYTILLTHLKSNNAFLRGYSVLYIRYFCPNWNIKLNDLAADVGVSDRSVRRWQQDGLRHLLLALMRQEMRLIHSVPA